MDEEASTGKIFVAGRDLQGRPILYMRPQYQNTKNYEEQNRLTVYMLERCVQSMVRMIIRAWKWSEKLFLFWG